MHGEKCLDDYDCHPKTKCWYQYNTDVLSNSKHCLNKYSYPSGTHFGWSPLYQDSLKDAILNGEVCESGWAANSDPLTHTAQCVQITNIMTDLSSA